MTVPLYGLGPKPTQDEIIRMAREAAHPFHLESELAIAWWCDNFLPKFAALVAAHEREACAKVCDDKIKSYTSKQYTTDPLGGYRERFAAEQCAAAIRARNNHG